MIVVCSEPPVRIDEVPTCATITDREGQTLDAFLLLCVVFKDHTLSDYSDMYSISCAFMSVVNSHKNSI